MMLEMPRRDIGSSFPLDTNRINARQRDDYMNQLEKWAQNDVIWLYMSEPANIEARRGGAAQRHRKVRQFGPTMLTLAYTTAERAFMRQIADILFPGSPKNENEWRDVEIVFNAKKYPGILITEDNDILGKRTQLSSLGIRVCTTSEAVEFVLKRIVLRDAKARKIAARTGEPLPYWVGKD
jgi:hypothetical protein